MNPKYSSFLSYSQTNCVSFSLLVFTNSHGKAHDPQKQTSKLCGAKPARSMIPAFTT